MTVAAMVPLRELGDWAGGNTPSKANASYWTNGTIPWVSPKDMKVDEITASEDRITQAALNEGRVSLVPEGSVLLVTRSGILAHTLPVAITKLPVTINQDLKALTPRTGVSPKYVAHAVRGASRRILKECSKHGTTVASIETNALLDFEIPLVELNEQHRIVGDIEKQFSRLDEAVANLKRAKTNLKRYKAAILRAAVNGTLVPTEAELARRDGRSYESGAQLVERVVSVCGGATRKRARSGQPPTSTSAGLPLLPDGWVWSTFDAVADRVTVGHVGPMKDEYVETGVPFLRSQNVRANRFDPEGLKYISAAFHASLSKSSLRPGDIVVVRSGSVGVSCVIPESLPEANCSDLVIIKRPKGVLPKFGAHYLNAVIESRIAAGRVGVALIHFNTQSVAQLPVPVPPLREQHRIVAEIERLLTIANEVEAEIDINWTREQALRQTTLAAAFAAPRADR